jgi:hypothetical protein
MLAVKQPDLSKILPGHYRGARDPQGKSAKPR